MNETELFEGIKSTIEGYDFIENCKNIERCGFSANQHIELELTTNVPSIEIRAKLEENLKEVYPALKFRFIFFVKV